MSSRTLKVGGITQFSATDYPGKIAAVIFVQGCPWRCGYCHNPHLQERPQHSPLDWTQIIAFLKRRVGLIDAVVFSGGEPTIDPALADAIAEVRQLGFLIGLHSACIYPKHLVHILPLIDWIGFDVKAPFERYERITAVADSGNPARECVKLILASGVEHECRTTIHPALLNEGEILDLAQDLAQLGVKNYVLQSFRAQGCNNSSLIGNVNNNVNGASTGDYPSPALRQKIAPLFKQFILRRAD